MDLRYIYALFLYLMLVIPLHGQSLEDAKQWYQEGRYAEALPVFMTEYQENSKDASLNHWIGASLYKTGHLVEAEKYLKFASGRKVNEAYLDLGELYSKLYRFEEAEKEFEKYQRANRRSDEALERLDQARYYADRLRRNVNRAEDIQIIDSIVVHKSALLSAYNLSNSSGLLMDASTFFKEQQSNRLMDGKTLYMNERKDKIYYSMEGSGSQLNLYTMEKLIDTFGNEKQLPDPVNGDGNQAYPFVMSDGLTIYFSSTGHQSYGGYDIYITRYNLASGSYLVPNQLNMPFNSPFNDYLLVIDEEKGVGWFASDRYQPADSVCVYTFIPNERVTLLENEDEAYMAGRAAISSISNSWREGISYGALQSLAKQAAVTEEIEEADFEFVINDQATYYRLADFKNNQARSIFSQAMGLEKQFQDIHEELARKRDQYAEEGNPTSGLRSSILDLERRSEILLKDIERLKIQARNEEIRSIFN